MKGAILWLMALAGLLWSGLGWLLFSVAGSGGAAVVAVTRWLGFEPSSTQWLADGVAAAGGLAQILVVAAWAVGMTALVAIGLLAGRAAKSAARLQTELDRQRGYRAGPILDGEVKERSIDAR